MQSGVTIQGPNTVLRGHDIVVTVTPGVKKVWLGIPGNGKGLTGFPVDAAGKAVIPAPNVPSGTLVWITTSRGVDGKILLVEVI